MVSWGEGVTSDLWRREGRCRLPGCCPGGGPVGVTCVREGRCRVILLGRPESTSVERASGERLIVIDGVELGPEGRLCEPS